MEPILNPSGIPAKPLFSYSEARELLGNVPESTWNKWIADGLVKPVRIGPRRCFIRYEDMVRLQAEGTPNVLKANGPKRKVSA